MTLSIDRQETPDGVRLVLRGEVDLSTGELLERELRRAEAAGGAVTIDLSGVDFFDSTGLQIVLDADIRAREESRRLAVAPGAGEAARVLEIANVVERLTVTEVEEGRDARPDRRPAE